MADTALILLRSGRYYDLLSPETSEITIEDIAHALAHIGRFTGHTSRFYSVAEHSLWVSRLVRPQHRLAALLHDAAEAVLGDVSQPLKRLLPDYRAIEQRVEAAILGQFGVTLPLHPVIKAADTLMLAAEAAQLMPPHDDEWEVLRGVPLLPINFFVRPPEEVAQAFVQRYREVTAQLDGGSPRPESAAFNDMLGALGGDDWETLS